MSIEEEAKKIRERLEQDQVDKIKVALFGQPGSGKSSLINKLFNEDVVKVSPSTDVTKEASIHEYSNVLLVDLPGYGTTRFPPNDFFSQFNIQDYDIYLCVFGGKFHEPDTKFFRELKQNGRTCIFVRNFSDALWQEGKTNEEQEQVIVGDLEKQVGSREKIIFTSCKTGKGIGNLSNEIECNLEEAKQGKWARGAKAYTLEALEKKRVACDQTINIHAGLAAANAVNPILGADFSVDIAIILKLFNKIRKDVYGLTDDNLKAKEDMLKAVDPIVKRVISHGSKAGITALLKRFGSRQLGKIAVKWIPLIGQLISASMGFLITREAGYSYRDDCHAVAKAILEDELKGM